ncbi:MAG: trigger factor [Candidatus Methylumidiphilus sp.]
MQVSIETTSELSRKMTVQVPEEKIQEQVSKKLKSLAGKVKIDGFRPGKAPQSVLQKRYGPGVREEVLAELIQSSFYDAVRDEKLKPVAGPSITPEPSEEGQGLRYVADFEVMPEFVLFPLAQMEVERYLCEVTDEDVEGMLLRLREQRKTWAESGLAAALGDRVTINFEGTSDGENFTSGKVESFPLVLGSKQLIPGFEDHLLGAVAGANLSFSLAFPEDYSVDKLAGKNAEFAVEVVKVEQSQLPVLDAEFAADFGIENGDVEIFRAEIKTSMEREMKRALAARSKDAVMHELHRRNESLSLPNALVNDEVKSLVNAYREEAKKRQQPFDEAAASGNLQPLARRRVVLGLLINKIIEENKLKVDPVRVRAAIDDLALSYEDPQEVVNWYYSNREQLAQVQNLVMEDQVVDLILAQGKVTERKLPFNELMRQPSEPAQA